MLPRVAAAWQDYNEAFVRCRTGPRREDDVRFGYFVVCIALIGSVSLTAQEPAEDWTLDVEPARLTLEVGETLTLTATVPRC